MKCFKVVVMDEQASWFVLYLKTLGYNFDMVHIPDKDAAPIKEQPANAQQTLCDASLNAEDGTAQS